MNRRSVSLSAGTPAPPVDSPRTRRSKTGCMTCRARKVRCDDNPALGESCRRCERLGVSCIRSDNASLSQEARDAMTDTADRRRDLNQAGMTRVRTSSSCQFCRSRRQKCTGDRPACARCVKAKKTCQYDITPHGGRSSSSAAAEPASRRSITADGRRGEIVEAMVGREDSDGPTAASSIATRSSALPEDITTSSRPTPGSLQDIDLVRKLTAAFFSEVASLRCFGFLHEPSFMENLEKVVSSPDPDPLLMSICALATKAAKFANLRDLGTAWARSALQIVFVRIARIDVRTLMAIVLLHEHFSRIEEQGLCFLLSSLACRFCQALQLNVEFDLDIACENSALDPTEKETRRRLMWACVCIDIETACGVDQLRLLREEDIRIQLPSPDDVFLYRMANVTGFLAPLGMPLTSIVTGSETRLGQRALHVQLTVCRDRILRYLKRHIREEDPSHPMSEFNQLAADLDSWEAALPADLRLTPDVIYVRQKQGTLSVLFALHAAYHQCSCDLYRCTVPDLQMPPKSFKAMNSAPPDFLERGRARWFDHACQLSEVFRRVLQTPRDSMSEPETSIAAYTAVRTKLYYLLHIMPDDERQVQAPIVNELLSVDLRYLAALKEVHPMAAKTFDAANEMIQTNDPKGGGVLPVGGVQNSPGAPSNDADEDFQAASPQVSADYLLHPLALFRLARRGITEKHEPEKVQNMGFVLSPDVNMPLFFGSAPYMASPRDLNEQWLSFLSDPGADLSQQLPWTKGPGMTLM